MKSYGQVLNSDGQKSLEKSERWATKSSVGVLRQNDQGTQYAESLQSMDARGRSQHQFRSPEKHW